MKFIRDKKQNIQEVARLKALFNMPNITFMILSLVYLYGFLCMFVHGFTLSFEDFYISCQQIFSFHAFFSWHSTNQNGDINIFEGHSIVVSWDNLYNIPWKLYYKYKYRTQEMFYDYKKERKIMFKLKSCIRQNTLILKYIHYFFLQNLEYKCIYYKHLS